MYACAAKVLCAWRTWLKNGVELPVSRHGQSTRPVTAKTPIFINLAASTGAIQRSGRRSLSCLFEDSLIFTQHGARGIKTPPPPPPPHRSRSVSQDKCGRGRAAAEARLDEAMLQPGLSYCFCGPH